MSKSKGLQDLISSKRSAGSNQRQAPLKTKEAHRMEQGCQRDGGRLRLQERAG